MKFRAAASHLIAFALSIFLTAPAFGDTLSCSALWTAEAERATPEQLARVFERMGFAVTSGRLVTFKAKNPIKNERYYFEYKHDWLTGAHTPQSEADYYLGMVAFLQEQEFNTVIDLGRSITAVDVNDPSLRWTFSLPEILKAHSVNDLLPFERVSLRRDLARRARRLPEAQPTLLGFALRSPLHVYADLSEAALEQKLKRQMKILAKQEFDREAGVESALVTAELLLRRGFYVEVTASTMSHFVVRITGSRGNSKFMQTLKRASEGVGGLFIMDPAWSARDRIADAVSNRLSFAYSINSRWLQNKKDAFENPTDSMMHELFHLENMRAWINDPEKDEIQSLNGKVQALGKVALKKFAYHNYFAFDEITAALADAQNATTEKDCRYYAQLAIELIDAVEWRTALTRYRAEHGNFTTYRMDSDPFMQIVVNLGQEIIFAFNFSDLDEQTPRPILRERFLKRLTIFERRMIELRREAERLK